MTQENQKFNVIPCTSCGQPYAGQGELVFDGAQVTGALCPPCASNNSSPETAHNVPTTEDTEHLGQHETWHSAFDLVALHGNERATIALLQSLSHRELKRVAPMLVSLVHHRTTYKAEITDTFEWVKEFREDYMGRFQNPTQDH